MKAILISRKPKECANILNLIQSILVLKTMPKCNLPIDVYIYCTKDKKHKLEYCGYNGGCWSANDGGEYFNGKIVAKFTLNKISAVKYQEEVTEDSKLFNQLTCLTDEELDKYLHKSSGYAWHIDNLEIFDKPKELREFEKVGSYNNPTIKCNKREQGRCNYGKSPFTGKWIGCEKARLTKSPQSFCYVEVE